MATARHLKNKTLRNNWHSLVLEAREAFRKDVELAEHEIAPAVDYWRSRGPV